MPVLIFNALMCHILIDMVILIAFAAAQLSMDTSEVDHPLFLALEGIPS
jgi:hypothetical protein